MLFRSEGSLDQQIGQRKTRLAEIETQLEAGRSALADKGREAEEAARSAGTLAKELEELRSQADLGTAGAAEAKALLSALAAAAQEVMDRDGAVRKESNELEDRLTEAQKEARTAQRRYDDAVEERDAVKNVIQGYQLRMDSRKKKWDQTRDAQVKLQMEENALTSRIRLLTEMEKEHEGYTKAVKLVMNEAQRGALHNIHGPVADLLKVPDRFTVAIETALGGAMQNIVVDREEDGKAVKIGRASCRERV